MSGSTGGEGSFGDDDSAVGSAGQDSFSGTPGQSDDPLATERETVIDLRDGGGVGESAGQLELERGGIVSARGTADGLIVRLDARAELNALLEALRAFATRRKSFLSNQQIDLEWVGGRPSASIEEELIGALAGEFGITVKATRTFTRDKFESSGNLLSEPPAPSAARAASRPKATKSWPSIEAASSERTGISEQGGREAPVGSRTSSLFDGVKTIQRSEAPKTRGGLNRTMAIDPLAWDEPDARFVQTTVRSGQRLESEHSLVVLGDVNNGAEVISGGDIIVLGKLRGVAHAGAYEETGGGRMIFALNLQPTQLRIGSVISRGSNETGGVPEVARVEGTLIVVVPYQSRTIGGVASILQRKT